MNASSKHVLISSSTKLDAAIIMRDQQDIEWFVLANEAGDWVGAVHQMELPPVTNSGDYSGSTLSSLATGEIETVGISESIARINERFAQFPVNRIIRTNDAGDIVDVFRREDIEQRILLSVPHMGPKDREYLLDAFDSNWVAPLGPHVDAFEAEIAAFCGVQDAAALSSGTAALHLALIIEGVERGHRVYCSDLTFVASVNAIMYQGATPVLIDAAPDSWNMSSVALERALDHDAQSGQLPKAIIVVNIYGQQADMDRIIPLATKYDIPIIEDAAESLGATYNSRSSGSFGKSAVFSFNGNKVITTSGGGMLVSDDSELIAKARFLSTQAREPVPYYLHEEVGYNYRMSNILAAIGRGQLSVLADRVATRRSIYVGYFEALNDLPGVSFMPELTNAYNTHWLSTMLLDNLATHATPDSLIAHLHEHGVEARNIWRPMHMQPVFERFDAVAHTTGKPLCSSGHYSRGVCLPSASSMTSGQRIRIIETLHKYLAECAR